jgi:hypothetical protein
MDAQEKVLAPLRQLYKLDAKHRRRIAQYVNNFKKHGSFLGMELSFLVQRLSHHGIEFDGSACEIRLLTVELVPQSCWFSNVRDHVDKDTWDRLRKATYKQAGYRCEVCGGQGPKWPVECHEVWRYDDQKRIQKLTGLIALCPSCHQVKHIGLAGVQGKEGIAKAHLAQVNGWTEKQVDDYLDEVWRVWDDHSRHQWNLDLSWLEQRGIRVKSKR